MRVMCFEFESLFCLFWIDFLAMLMAVPNMATLTTSTTATGPAKAQINPFSVDSQHLKINKEKIKMKEKLNRAYKVLKFFYSKYIIYFISSSICRLYLILVCNSKPQKRHGNRSWRFIRFCNGNEK